MRDHETDEVTILGAVATLGAIIFALWAIWMVIDLVSSRTTPQSGQVGVVRNGAAKAWFPDWFDNKGIRGVVHNGEGNQFIGLGSNVHYYPANTQQRYFRSASPVDGAGHVVAGETAANADGQAITVPTSDGVEATISGTLYLKTNFDGTPEGDELMKKFDTQFATRTFGPDGKHVYDGNDGYKAFLASQVEPIVTNNMRQVISGVTCAELVSSCALVQNNSNLAFAQQSKLSEGHSNQTNTQRVQQAVEDGFKQDLEETLGEEYYDPDSIRFVLAGVQLPPKVQDAISTAQSSFAQVSQSQAGVQRAKLDSKANEIKQRGYNKCPTCAAIDQTKAIPAHISVWAPGSKSGIAIGATP